MLVDMADFFIKQNKKSLPTFSVSRLNIKIKRCASIIQPSAPLPEQPLQQVQHIEFLPERATVLLIPQINAS